MAAGAPSSSNNVWGATTPGGVALGKDSVASGATAVDPVTNTIRVAPSIAIGLASTSAGLDTITIGISARNSKSYGISMGKELMLVVIMVLLLVIKHRLCRTMLWL